MDLVQVRVPHPGPPTVISPVSALITPLFLGLAAILVAHAQDDDEYLDDLDIPKLDQPTRLSPLQQQAIAESEFQHRCLAVLETVPLLAVLVPVKFNRAMGVEVDDPISFRLVRWLDIGHPVLYDSSGWELSQGLLAAKTGSTDPVDRPRRLVGDYVPVEEVEALARGFNSALAAELSLEIVPPCGPLVGLGGARVSGWRRPLPRAPPRRSWAERRPAGTLSAAGCDGAPVAAGGVGPDVSTGPGLTRSAGAPWQGASLSSPPPSWQIASLRWA